MSISANMRRQVSPLTTRRRVTGWTPPSARVAPIARGPRRRPPGSKPGVDVGGLVGVEVEAPCPARSRAIASLRPLVARSESRTSSSTSRSRPAKRESPSRRKSHFSSAVPPGARLVDARAPELTRGLVSPSAASSTAITESNGSPVAFTPSRSRASRCPSASQTSAKMNGLTTLWMVKRWALSPTEKTRPRTPRSRCRRDPATPAAKAGM